MGKDTERIRAYLREQLHRNRELREAASLGEGPQRMAHALREWQVRRLRETFADLTDNPGYSKATAFFLDDLYSVEGFESRDDELEKIVPIMMRLLPAHLVQTVGKAMELQALSQELDIKLAQILQDHHVAPGEISVADYTQAYIESGLRQEREHQIDLICDVGHELNSVVDKPFIYGALKLCRRPARAAGLGDLQTFLERGFQAYRSMADPDWFIHQIEVRERHILDRLMHGHRDPFDIAAVIESSPDA